MKGAMNRSNQKLTGLDERDIGDGEAEGTMVSCTSRVGFTGLCIDNKAAWSE